MTVEFNFKLGDHVRLLRNHGSVFADEGDTGEIVFGDANLDGRVTYGVELDNPKSADRKKVICNQHGLEKIAFKFPSVPFKAVCLFANGPEAEDEFVERKLYNVIPQPDGLFRIRGAHGNWWGDVYEEGGMININFGLLDFAYFMPVEE